MIPSYIKIEIMNVKINYAYYMSVLSNLLVNTNTNKSAVDMQRRRIFTFFKTWNNHYSVYTYVSEFTHTCMPQSVAKDLIKKGSHNKGKV